MKNIKIILRGIGQVFFQNNALTGLVFLVGIFYNSWILGLGALLGNITSTLFARIFKYNKGDIENGLYGFNGTLVGAAVLFFLKINLITIIFLTLGSVLSTVIIHLIKNKIPAFTSPFVISAWIIIYVIILLFPSYILTSPSTTENVFNILKSTTKGFGEVMFQDSIITGVFFMIGILVNSFKDFGYAFYGSILSTILALMFMIPMNTINMGLIGYNAILTSIALGINDKRNSYMLVTIGIVLSILIYLVFNVLGVIALTAPFVISTWIVLFLFNKNYLTKMHHLIN